ncbi:MAG: hypothetical protein ACOX6E_07845 [Syntrophomonadaceae bacterium]|jgi:hypothetical protein
MGKRLILFLTILLVLIAWPNYVQAKGEQEIPPKRVIIYMIDKLDLSDLDPLATPHLWNLQKKAGLGLLNTLSAGERTTKNVACTISAGKLAVSSSYADLNYKATEKVRSEKAGDVFFRNTGTKPFDNNIVVSNINIIKRNNEIRSLANPGKLGDELHTLDLKTSLIGNSDFFNDYSRPGALILMDSNGIVDNGLVDIKTVDESSAFPPSTRYPMILEAFQQYKSYDLILIEFGDLARLEKVQDLYSDRQLQQARKTVLKKIDLCIGDLQKQLINTDVLYVISPTPSRLAFQRGELLTPLIIDKPGMAGLLTSYSTHYDGIVSSISLKNSILHNFNPTIPNPIYSQSLTNTYDTLTDTSKRLVFQYVNQALVIPILIVLILLSLVLTLLARVKNAHPIIQNFFMTFVVAFPLSLLLIANFDIFNRWYYLFFAFSINIIICLICLLISHVLHCHPLLVPLLLTISTIILDLILELSMLQHSMLSYRVISGLRYYGLGNEYMGVILGCTIAYSAFKLQKSYSRSNLLWIAFLFGLVIFFIVFPLFGTNVGGGITAFMGLGYTYLSYRQLSIKPNKIVVLIIGTIALVIIMAIIDLILPLEIQSHLGRSISLILEGNWSEILHIIDRKIQMQLRIINYSIAGWFLLSLVLLCFNLLFRPATNHLRFFKEKYPVIYSASQGLIISAVIAILINDSGITSAALLFLYLVILFINFLPLAKYHVKH